MNKKGFTLIELLAVIAIIALIALITIPTIKYADRKFHEKAYNTKLAIIKNAAKEYGDDFREYIMNSSNSQTYTDPSNNTAYPAISITVKDLLNNGYISKDADIKTNDVLDPRNDSSMLNQRIIIYVKNDRSYAVLSNN